MAVLAVSERNEDISFVAADAGGDQVPSGIENAAHHLGGVFLLVDNAHTGPHTVTVDGVDYVVPDGEMHALPANRGVYPNTLLDVTYSAVTALTVAAVRL